MSFIIWRQSNSSDRKQIDKFFDRAHNDYQSGRLDYNQFRSLIADMICMANNLGIDRTLGHMQTELKLWENPMAFEQLKTEIAMLFAEMENQPENKWELHETLREKLEELRSFGMPLPQDLVDLEKMLDEELANQNNS